MVFSGIFSLFVGVALFRWGKCQSFPGNVNAGNPVNTGNYGNGGNYGSVGTGSFVPANQRNCAVVSVKAQPMFDMKSFAGDWKVVKRSHMRTIDPIIYDTFEMFSNSVFFKTKTHSMNAFISSRTGRDNEEVLTVSGSTTRSMNLFGISWDICQSIPPIHLSARNPANPGQLSLRFRLDETLGVDTNLDLTQFMNGVFGRNFFEFFVLSTDYQNYAVVWNCKRILPNGNCGDNMVLVMSRGKALSQYYEQLVKAKLATICVDYKDLEDEAHMGVMCAHDTD